MANQLDPMDLKQIITLHKDGFSNRDIGKMLDISRNTINTYMKLFKACDYSFDQLLAMDVAALGKLFTSSTTIENARYDELMQHFEQENINLDSEHPGFTLKFHHKEYEQKYSNAYSYTQYLEHYRRKYAKNKGSMKLEHVAGKELFIDFAGKKLEIVDKETGNVIPVEVFVAILPKSQYTYVEACKSQKRDDLFYCLGNALSYYGGVPKAIVSDNLKTAVNRASKYEPVINRSFKEYGQHYNCIINPTRTYSPQDKALVENAVNLAYQRIYYPLRKMTFFSLSDLNREIKRLLTDYNNLLLQRKEASRRELFQSVERSYLKPLPASKYELKDYRRSKVQKMGYVYFSPDKSYYSVPHRYIGKGTMIHYTSTTVEVYHNHQRIAIHKRDKSKGIYHTNKEHLCSTNKAYLDWSPDFFRKKAAAHGPQVLNVINQLFIDCDYPETAYKRAMGIIQLHRTYGAERLNKACEIAMYVQSCSFQRISNILKNNQDQHFEPLEEGQKSHIPNHKNKRGPSAYQ
ncbi:MAG: IS21 family transposase [Cyclobacteriaceae bacterium]